MAEFWRTRQFKALSKVWDYKLEQTGFKDVEIEIKGDRALKQKATNCYRQASQLERESRLEYYCFLGYLVHNTQFENEIDKLVMFKHSEGATIKEIVEVIKATGNRRDRRTIRFIIRRWQAKWGIKSWTLQQMNLKKK